MPPPKSTNVLPSTSVSRAPSRVIDPDRRPQRLRARDDALLAGGQLARARAGDLGAEDDRHVAPSCIAVGTYSQYRARHAAARRRRRPPLRLRDGPVRRRHPPRDRRGAHPSRPLRPGAGPARVDRRPLRPPLPRLPQQPLRRSSTSSVPMPDLTELVEAPDDEAVHPPSRRVRPGLDAGAPDARRRHRRAARGQELAGPPRPAGALDGGLRRPGLRRPRDARALERREPPHHALPAA